MKRHISLALFRLLLALGLVYALPLSHAKWGEEYPGDGQQGFGFIIIFFVIGLAAAVVFVGLGSLGQFLIRKRSARFTVFTDLTLFLVFAGVLIYGGVSARYNDTPPNKSPEPTAVGASSLRSQRRHESVAPQEMFASRNVVAVAVGVASRWWLSVLR